MRQVSPRTTTRCASALGTGTSRLGEVTRCTIFGSGASQTVCGNSSRADPHLHRPLESS
jgi:hypothetical protein